MCFQHGCVGNKVGLRILAWKTVVGQALGQGSKAGFRSKVAAQVGHAAVGLYQAMQEKNSWREMAWKWDHSG